MNRIIAFFSKPLEWGETLIFLVFHVYLVIVALDFIFPYERSWFFYNTLVGYGGEHQIHFLLHIIWITVTLLSVIPYYYYLEEKPGCSSSFWWVVFITRVLVEGFDMRLRLLDFLALQHNLPLLALAYLIRDALILAPSYVAQYMQLTRPSDKA